MSAGRFARVLAVAVLLSSAAAHAVVLCRAHSGRVAVRTKCRKGERPLDASQLDLSALAGASGAPGSAGPTGTYPLALVDSRGVELGEIRTLFSVFGAFVAITHPALGATVLFDVTPQDYVHNTAGAQSTVYYATADCSGVPFLLFADRTNPVAQIFGTSAYIPTGDVHTQPYQSGEYDPGGSPCGGGTTDTGRGTCCGTVTPDSTNLSAAARVPLSALGFMPPFRLVAR